MTIPLVNRNPTDTELERFRLVLSAYQNAFQPSNLSDQTTPPGGEDFIRTVAAVFNGVLTPVHYRLSFDLMLHSDNTNVRYGIDCKVHRVTHFDSLKPNPYEIRLSFPHNFIRDSLFEKDIDINISRNQPKELGEYILKIILTRNQKFDDLNIDFNRSSYLMLLFDRQGNYQLAQFSYNLPESDKIEWSFPNKKISNTLTGSEDGNLRFKCSLPIAGHHRDFVFYYPSPERINWISPIFQLESHASIENMEYGVNTRAELLKQAALEELSRLIETNADEKDFQRLLEENLWIFGSEYIRRFERRRWTRDEQVDFMLKRTADGFLEMIEIKTPMNNLPLFIKDRSHDTLYFRSEIAIVISQVANYLEKLDAKRHEILAEDSEDVGKIRAKIIIGRDGDDKQLQALRRLNSHLYRIEIITFDQLLRIAKRVLEDQ